MKTIEREQDEKKFHKQLKLKFPEFVVNMKINGHDKDETYVFDMALYEAFLLYADKVKFSEKDIKLEKDVNDMMNNYFGNMDTLFEIELVKKITKIVKMQDITNEFQKELAVSMTKFHYDYVTLKENNRHIESIKDKEIELKRIELECIKAQKCI